MDITSQILIDFRTIFPEFADSTKFSDVQLNVALHDAEEETGGSCWGSYTQYSIKQRAMFNFAAHKLVSNKFRTQQVAMGAAPSFAAPLSSQSVKDESQSFAVPTDFSSADAGLMATSYGQEFLRLSKKVGGAIIV